MPHVSKNRVKKKVFQEIYDSLIEAVFKSTDRDQSRKLLVELLTPTERVMLAKRLAMIAMLDRGYSFYRISRELKVSFSTVARFYKQVVSGKYSYLTKLLTQSKETKINWGKILRGGLPPRVGKGRWAALYKPVKP